jgi:hypothetical protein
MFKVLFENEGDPYIRIRLKGENLKSINIFKSIFSKLLTLYDEKYNDIADFYSEYIPNFNIVEEKKIIQRKSKISDSIVFPKNYSRFCPVDRIPTIINEEDVKLITKELILTLNITNKANEILVTGKLDKRGDIEIINTKLESYSLKNFPPLTNSIL